MDTSLLCDLFLQRCFVGQSTRLDRWIKASFRVSGASGVSDGYAALFSAIQQIGQLDVVLFELESSWRAFC
jgi:hypothetical protein